MLHYRYNALDYARLGLVVSKKMARRAVDRNYMKRVLREKFRLNQHVLAGLDIVARPGILFSHAQFTEIEHEFAELVVKLQRKLVSQLDAK